STTRRTIAFVVGGAGAAAIATGTVFAMVSIFEYGESKGGCNAANQCVPDALASRQHSLRHGDFATVFLAAGAARVAAGAIVWLTAPRERAVPTARPVGVALAASTAGGALVLRGEL